MASENTQSAAPGVAVEQELQQEFENRVRFNPLNPKNCLDKNADDEYISPFIYACWMEFIAGARFQASRAAILAGAAGGGDTRTFWLYELEKGKGVYQGVTGPDAESICKRCAEGFDEAGEPFPVAAHPPVPVRAPQVTDAEVEAALRGMRFTATGLPKPEDMRRALEAFAASRQGAGALPADSYEELWNAFQRIDTAAVALPTFKINHEGGITAVAQNIVDAILAATPPIEFAPGSSRELNAIHAVVMNIGGDWPEVEGDPYTLHHVKRMARELQAATPPSAAPTEPIPPVYLADGVTSNPDWLAYKHCVLNPAIRAQREAGEVQVDAARDVFAERARQVSAEGWTPEHDSLHSDGHLALAGACYAIHAAGSPRSKRLSDPPGYWPWHIADWKPKDARRDLVRSAALVIAEIERLDRAAIERPSWICKGCTSPEHCKAIQGCDTVEARESDINPIASHQAGVSGGA